MSEPASIVEAQLKALLNLVKSHRDTECQKLQADAQNQASALIRQAHHEARKRMHAAVQEERNRFQVRIESTRAQLQTRSRQRRQQAALLLLHQGWEQLEAEIRRRWQNADSRKQWVDALLDRAVELLPLGAWQVEHPHGWSDNEIEDVQTRISEYTGHESQFQCQDNINAGLRIFSHGACLDGTLEGLLADRDKVEAKLLAKLGKFGVEG